MARVRLRGTKHATFIDACIYAWNAIGVDMHIQYLELIREHNRPS